MTRSRTRRARWGAVELALCTLLASACARDDGGTGREASVAPADAADVLRSDRRIASLLAPCSQRQYYDRDTSDLLPVLIEKLERGYMEPLQRAKDELASMGEEAMSHVRRLAERNFNDAAEMSTVHNALDVAVMSRAATARGIVLMFLDHPSSTLRQTAVRGLLQHHVRPEDFDRLWIQLDAEAVALQEWLVQCLHTADPARAEAIFLEWIDTGMAQHLWTLVGPMIAASELEATAARATAMAPDSSIAMKPFLAACAARAGDPGALEILREELASGEESRRARAVEAAGVAKLETLLVFSAANDPSVGVRGIAVGFLAPIVKANPRPELVASLQECAADPARPVRNVALSALLSLGDAGAADQTLAMLGGTLEDLQDAVLVSRDRWGVDAGLARRVFERLRMLDERDSHRPLAERLSNLKAIGTVPGRESAQYLRSIGLVGEGPVSGLRAHELMTIYAANSGEEGRAFLFDELEHERDPLRRVDLLYAASAHRTDAARTRLHAFVVREDVSPYEILYAADLLARLGPSQAVAPVLKRVCYRMGQEDVQLAMRCLLWNWY